MDIENEVLRRVSPSPTQRARVARVAGELLSEVTEASKSEGEAIECMLVGSVAKDTYTHPPDIDIFILFEASTSREHLEESGLRIGRKVLINGEERYAEHPYIHGRKGGFDVDLVPCFKIDSPVGLKSAVDRTPFHTRYVEARMSTSQKQEVRILKQFMKGIGVYGAEAKVQGFSGYLVELLILKYRSFQGTLEAASKWNHGTVLDLGERGGEFDSPLIFYDPVDASRNVASAVSRNAFALFVQAAIEYLRKPSPEFFFPRKQKIWSMTRVKKELTRRRTRILAVRFPRPDLIDDDLYPQARRSIDGLGALLSSGGYRVLDRTVCVGARRVTLIYELEGDRLPLVQEHVGPPSWLPNSREFLKKWSGRAVSGPFLSDGRWMAIVERKHSEAAAFLRAEAGKAALGSGFKDVARMKVLSHSQALNAGLQQEFTKHLDRTLPWKRA